MASEEKVLITVKVDDKQAKSSLENVTKSTKATSNTALEAAGSFTVMGVSLNSVKAGFAKVIPIARMMFASIKAGLISTGIGALVVAVGSLLAFLIKTKEGSEILTVTFKAMGAIVNVLVDRLSDLGGAIIKVFQGDFKGALNDAKKAVSGIGDEMRKEFMETGKLAIAFNKLRDATRAINVETAARRAEVEALKLVAEDLSKGEEERLEAAQEAFKIENELLNQRVANAEEALRIQQEEMAMSKNMAEDLDKEAQLQIELFNIKQESITKQIELNNKINSIKREAEAKELKALDEIKKKAEEVEQAKLDLASETAQMLQDFNVAMITDEKEKEIAILENAKIAREKEIEESLADRKTKDEALILLNEKFRLDLANIFTKFQLIEDKQNEENLKKQEDDFRAVQDTKINAMNLGLNAMADGFGRETAAGKAAAIAQATMNTHTAATRALKDFPVPFNFVAMAGIITTGLLQVKKIMDTPKPAKMNTGGLVGGIGTGTSDSVNARLSKGESVINARSTRMFKPLLSAINEAGGGSAFADKSSISTQSQGITGGVVKAFVVADEMTNTQDRLTKIRRKATI